MKQVTRLVYNVGINDANYRVQEWAIVDGGDGKRKQRLVWICPFYSRWRDMLKRCYSHKYQETRPTYIGCSVCDEWLTFSVFRAWMETQNWDGKELDKDILVPGNRVYSPNVCVFIDRRVNSFVLENGASCRKLMVGASFNKTATRFKAFCNDGSGKQKYLGSFPTELEAHFAWLSFKKEMALQLAAEQTDPRVAKALIDRYDNYVAEIGKSL